MAFVIIWNFISLKKFRKFCITGNSFTKGIILTDEQNISFPYIIEFRTPFCRRNIRGWKIVSRPKEYVIVIPRLHLDIENSTGILYIDIKPDSTGIVEIFNRIFRPEILNMFNMNPEKCFKNTPAQVFILHYLTENKIICNSQIFPGFWKLTHSNLLSPLCLYFLRKNHHFHHIGNFRCLINL